MLYKELNHVDFIRYEHINSIQKLKDEFHINAPASVMSQFYLDHSDKSSFLELYGDINLYTIKWKLIDIQIDELLSVVDAATYPEFVEEVANTISYNKERNNMFIDVRDDVVQYWEKYGTWKTPPIFLDGTILKTPTTKLHLVEGHTRLGNLKGIFKEGLLKLANFHKIYYGEY